MAPQAAVNQRPGMPSKATSGAVAKANQQQAATQRSSTNTPNTNTNAAAATSSQQAARGAPTNLATAPNTFVALESTVKMILQQTGYVLNGPGRLEERRDAYQTNFNELYSRFQQLADRLDDEVCHAKQVVRGQYAMHLEVQRRKKRQREEEEEAAEQARKRQKQKDLETQMRKEKERLELEVQQQRKKKEEEEEAEKRRLAKLMEVQKSQQDVVMLDSPADTPQSAGMNKVSSTAQAAGQQQLGSNNVESTKGLVKPAFPVVTPPAENNDGANNNADGSADFDIDSLFGMPGAQTTEQNNSSLNTTTDQAFLDPSADVASLIPGIESYASMDASQSGTTVPASTTTVAAAPDVMDFSTPGVSGTADTQASDTMQVDASTADYDDEFMNFMNDTSGADMDQTTSDSFDDWFKDM